ncbi:MAG: glycosyltransferase family 9 protein [Thermoguttaceae bacterium]|nr:glycosyltransferase family 9 protein [Thermoguttaceae bacterium]MBR4103756.1 glycosyltransferase family 9 protein [Thermoguttaceae bacterium]
MGVWKKLAYRIERLRVKYPDSDRKALARLGIWCFRALLKPRRFYAEERSTFPKRLIRSFDAARSDGSLKLLFLLSGGLGDLVATGPFFKALRRRFPDDAVRFYVAASASRDALSAIFRGFGFLELVERNALETPDFSEKFDAIFDVNRLPNVLACDRETLAFFSPDVAEYVERLSASAAARPTLFQTYSNADYSQVAFALANGRSMRTQCDFDGFLGLTEAERPLAALDETVADVLKNNGLKPGEYATLQRGVGGGPTSKKNVRLWPWRYYRELVAKTRAEFPTLKLVWLGRRGDESADEEAASGDLDLRDATSFEELKFLLKNSALHIDGECGMPHVAHTLGARSAVFWGQTQPAYCGYSENINVFAPDGCPFPCGFSLNDWQTNCARGFEEPPCMTRLTPELFFDAIRPALREIVERPKFDWERVEETTSQTIENVGDNDGAKSENAAETTLFLGDFPLETLLEARRSGKRVLWFSLRTSPKAIVESRALGIDADWADATNVPEKDGTLDRIVCDVEEPSECVRRELLRVAKIGGTARFGKNGGVWRKRVVGNDGTSEN